MQWKGRRGSGNIEDRRTSGGPRGKGVGKGVGTGIGGVGLIVVLLAGWALGIDVTPLLQGAQAPSPAATANLGAEDRRMGEFVSVTLADTEEIWAGVFRGQTGRDYVPVQLVLYRDATSSPCGEASGVTGPFYCPADRRIYLDTAFFVTLEHQLGAGGDFAAAYVVAHEVAHHVQNQLGVLGEANRIRQQSPKAEGNLISVMVELQADCLSGIWARGAQRQLGTLDRGDLEEALNAARQIGDDTLQSRAGQTPMPHIFTHGTSDQRSRWFQRGLTSGQLEDCNTFEAARL